LICEDSRQARQDQPATGPIVNSTSLALTLLSAVDQLGDRFGDPF
jgi:hypothetical protein